MPPIDGRRAGRPPPPQFGGYYQYVPPMPAPRPSNGIGTAGFVCGLVGVLLFWIPLLGAALSTAGLVMGNQGYVAGGRWALRLGSR